LPEGQIFPAAGLSPGCWTAVAIHDSKQSCERFRDHVLMPKMQQGITGGFAGPVQDSTFDIHKLMH
jgi:hypothetical protein